jgi:hypothetical protein
VTPLRDIGVAFGVLIVGATLASVLRTLIIPRGSFGFYGRLCDKAVDAAFLMASRRVDNYEERDNVLAAQAAVYLVVLLASWLAGFLVGFALILWPATNDIQAAFRESASSLFTLGFVPASGNTTTAVDVVEAGFGLFTVAAQIGYLPTLYSAFNRRETEVTLLGSRAGAPPWGPELLARTKYGIRATGDDLPQFYANWERWAADIGESHSNFPILMRFRSPQPNSSWLVGLLAVMDSAALLLAVAPSRDRIEPRLCLRMGFTALSQLGHAVGIQAERDPDPDADIVLTFEDFQLGYQRLADVGFDMERTAEEAWPHFRGWRVNYEKVAYKLAYQTDAVPAYWSGPRRWKHEPIAPYRPPNRAPKGSEPIKTKPS